MGKMIKQELFEMYENYLDKKHEPIEIEGSTYSASKSFKMIDPVAYKICYYKWLDAAIASKELSPDGYEYEDFGNPELATVLWFDCAQGKGSVQRQDGLIMPIVYGLIDGIKETPAGCPSYADQEKLMDLHGRPIALVTTGSSKFYTARATKIYIFKEKTAHISSSIFKSA